LLYKLEFSRLQRLVKPGLRGETATISAVVTVFEMSALCFKLMFLFNTITADPFSPWLILPLFLYQTLSFYQHGW
jgi:hypothetical protein